MVHEAKRAAKAFFWVKRFCFLVNDTVADRARALQNPWILKYGIDCHTVAYRYSILAIF